MRDFYSNEDVHLVGTGTFKTHVVTDANGRSHVTLSGIIDVTGTGVTSGAQYSGRQAFEQHIDPDTDSAPFNFTFTETSLLIGHGAVPNEDLQTTSHITINANGDLTTAFVSGGISCHPPL